MLPHLCAKVRTLNSQNKKPCTTFSRLHSTYCILIKQNNLKKKLLSQQRDEAMRIRYREVSRDENRTGKFSSRKPIFINL